MTEDELIALHPRLYHMAAAGSWPDIRAKGLLTTRQLVDVCNPDDAIRDQILGRRRETSVTLRHPDGALAVIRDQAPLRDRFLRASLTDMSLREWLDVLNGRVFFWLRPAELSRLLGARLYRGREHDVLTVDTTRLLRAHGESVRLSAINSGATLFPNSAARGSRTFLPVEDFPGAARPGRRRVRAVELAVLDGVPDIADHVVRVERRRGDKVLEVLHDHE